MTISTHAILFEDEHGSHIFLDGSRNQLVEVIPQPLHTILYSINQERLKNGEIEQRF